MNTSSFDVNYCVSWSLLDPRPCLYRVGSEVVVCWNGVIMPYNLALALTADILFQTPISYGISDQIAEDYEKLNKLGIVPDNKNISNNRSLYSGLRKTMHKHINNLGTTLKNPKQALLWFNKEQCINDQKNNQ